MPTPSTPVASAHHSLEKGALVDHVLIENLISEVEIPVDGTLSRVLAKHGVVRLVVFAFDENQELTEHTAGVPVIIQVLSGAVTISVGGEDHLMSPASWLFLDADVPHSVTAHEPARLLLTMIRCV